MKISNSNQRSRYSRFRWLLNSIAFAFLLYSLGACRSGQPGDGEDCGIPSYYPLFWNDGGFRQLHNNCYNYSNNVATNTFAQPGRRAGAEFKAMTCYEVGLAALADGLAPGVPCPDTECLLALVVAPGQDYHWYRRDSNGSWSHKPGATEATDRDNSGNPIADPENADRGIYTDFCGYYCSCSEDYEGSGNENIQ